MIRISCAVYCLALHQGFTMLINRFFTGYWAKRPQSIGWTFRCLLQLTTFLVCVSGSSLLGQPPISCFDINADQKISDTAGNFTGSLNPQDYMGSSLAFLGDFNNDGTPDIATGAQWDDDGGADKGAIWLLFLNPNGTVQAHQKISETQGGFGGTITTSGNFGASVQPIGDLNNDGVTDLAVGEPHCSDGGANRGAIWILLMNANGTVNSEQKISDTQGGFLGVLNNNDEFGQSVTNLGDLNNDGVTDLAVGAPLDDDGGADRGAVWILFMNANVTVNSHQKISDTQGGFNGGLNNSDGFGHAIDAIGDLDGDGINDIAIGAPLDDDGGTDYGALWVVFLNANGTVKDQHKVSASTGCFLGTLATGDQFGFSLADLGDLNGDGITDLLVGAPYDDDGGINKGAVYCLSIKSTGDVLGHFKVSETQGGLSATLAPDDLFGYAVGGAMDIDGDGIRDLAIGLPGDDDGANAQGAIQVLFPTDICLNCSPLGGTMFSREIAAPGREFCKEVVQTDDGGIAMVGWTNSFGVTNEDGFIIKYNGCSEMEWWKTYSPDLTSTQFAVFAGSITAQDCGLISVGESSSSSVNPIIRRGFMTKTDCDGNVLWGRNIESTGRSISLIQPIKTPNGGYAFLGRTDSTGIIASAAIFVMGTNAAGVTQWAKRYTSPAGYEIPRAMELTADSGLIVVGSRQETSTVPMTLATRQVSVMRLDSVGNVQWFKQYNLNSDYEEAFAVQELPGGDFLVGGYYNPNGVNSDNALLMRIDANGNLLWTKSYAGNSKEQISAIVPTPDGNFVLHGETTSYGAGGVDKMLLKVDAQGNLLWSNTYGDANNNYSGIQAAGKGIFLTNDGGFFFGFSTAYWGSPYNHEINLVKTDSLGAVPCLTTPFSPPVTNITLTPSNVAHTNASVPVTNNLVSVLTTTSNPNDTLFCFAILCDLPTDFLGPDTTICGIDSLVLSAGGVYSHYLWSTGDTIDSIVIDSSGVYSLQITDSDGCTETDTIIVNFGSYPSLQLTNDTVLCSTAGFQLSAQDTSGVANTFSWKPDTLLNDSTLAAPLIVFDTSAIYHITVSDSATGCAVTDSVTISLAPPLVLMVSSDTFICSEDSVQLQVQNPGVYQWSPGGSLDDSTSANPWASPDSTTEYQLVITDTFGCDYFDSVTVTVNELPQIDLGPDTSFCHGDSIVFDASGGFLSYVWQNGSNDSLHIASIQGQYSITVTNACGQGVDTMVVDTVFPLPLFSLGNDTGICSNDSLLLFVAIAQVSYLWSTGDVTDSLWLQSGNVYWAEVTDSNGCSFRDSMELISQPLPVVLLGNDTTVCSDDSIGWWFNEPNASYLWHNGSTDSSLVTSGPGQVWVEVTNHCGISSDSIEVDSLPYPFTNLGPDSAFCENDSTVLVAAFPGASYVWFNASTDSIYIAKNDGFYWVEITNSCGTFSDSIDIRVDDTLNLDLGPDTVLCPNDSLLLSTYLDEELAHIWQNGSHGNGFLVVASSTYWVMVSNTCGQGSDTIVVAFDALPQIDLGPQQLLCSGDSAVLDASFSGASYLWNTSDTSAIVTAKKTGTYQVTVTNHCGNSQETVLLEFQDTLQIDLGANILSCFGSVEVLSPTLNQPVTLTWSNGQTQQELFTSRSDTFWVSGSNVCGTVTDSISVTFNPIPAVFVPKDTTVCAGDEVLLEGRATGSQLTWSTGELATQINVSESGIYWAQMQNNCGTARDSVEIFSRPLPRPNLGPDQEVCIDEPVELIAGNRWAKALWHDGDTSTKRSFIDTGRYSIQVWDEVGCVGQDSIELFGCPTIWIPNSFSPDGDPFNEVFKPVAINLLDYHFEIYNRWGELIFETTELEAGWNGMYNGQQAPIGVYAWKISFTNRTMREEHRTGSVTLFR